MGKQGRPVGSGRLLVCLTCGEAWFADKYPTATKCSECESLLALYEPDPKRPTKFCYRLVRPEEEKKE